MKKRWQIKKSHQSDPTCGVQTSREAFSATDRQRKQKKKDRQSDPVRGSEGGDRSPGEEVIARPKRQRKTKKRLSDPVRGIYGDAMDGEESVPPAQQHKTFSQLLPASNRDGDLQAAVEASAAPAGKEKAKRIVSKTKQMRSKLYRVFSENCDVAYVILKSGNHDGNLQAVGEASSAPAGKKKGKRIGLKTQQTKSSPSDPGGESNVGVLKGSPGEEIARPEQLQHSRKKKKEALDDDKEEAREASFEEESPSSGDLVGKIAQDADKEEARETTLEEGTPSYCDLGKIAHDDADEVDNDIDNKQGQEAGKIKALLDLDDATVSDQIWYYYDQLNCCLAEDDDNFWADYDEPQLIEVCERLALYRIKAHELSKGIELDTATLKRRYPVATLQDEGYFEHYERSLGWYFDPERCKIAGLEDYQRLMLHQDDLYESWDYYQRTYSTYKGDEEYVQFWEEMSEKTKWIEDYIFKPQWEKCERRAYYQYLGIATRFHNIFADVVMRGFKEYVWSVQFDFSCYKKLYALYLEIWKRVAKQKMNFADALREIYDGDMFPLCHSEMEIELENRDPMFYNMKNNYDAYVACIDDEVSEDDAVPLIIKAVTKMTPKPKIYVDYARKKVAVADAVGLIHGESLASGDLHKGVREGRQ